VYFRSDVPDLTRDRLRVEVDAYGAPVLVLVNLRAQEWQANLRVPAGLAAGPHQVRLRTSDSDYSKAFQIWRAGLIPRGASAPQKEPRAITEPAPEIYEVSNGMTDSNVFHGHRNEYICCRFRTPEQALDRESVLLQIDDAAQPVLFLTDLGAGCWQANSRPPADQKPGSRSVRIRTLQSAFSDPAQIFFQPSSS